MNHKHTIKARLSAILFTFAILFSFSVVAGTLTSEQQAALKAYVEADATLNQIPHSWDGSIELANRLQDPNPSTFIVWRSSVSQDEIMQNGFDWTRVDNLSVGKSRIWEWMFNNQTREINPSKVNVRAGIEAVWVGTAADLAVRAAVYIHCKRQASRLEKLFATGTGTDATPATMTIEGSLDYNTVYDAMGW